MSLTRNLIVFQICIAPFAVAAKDTYIPKSSEMALATMAAADSGYSVTDPHNTLEELNVEGEMYPGYFNLGLEVAPDVPVGTVFAPDMAMNPAIRIDTADVVNTYGCTILRYPDLMTFRRKWLKKNGNKPVSLDQIENEIKCGTLKVITASTASHATK